VINIIKILASGSSGNAYLIETEFETIILECGIRYDSIKRGLGYKLDKVKAVLISHTHKDHAMSARKLIDDGVNIYGPAELTDKLHEEGANNRRLFPIAEHQTVSIGNFKVKPFKNYHRNSDGSDCECLGYLIYHKEIGTILFATDTYLIKPVFSNVQHLLIECNYSDEMEEENREDHDTRRLESHMSLNNLKTFIARWNLERTNSITLIHLSKERSDEELMKSEIEELTGKKVYIAKKGLIIDG
jgi:phosphoribosyl 1,2-cyclic phosphodiesterase